MSMEASEICITAEALDREQNPECMIEHPQTPRNTLLNTASIALRLPAQLHSPPSVTSTFGSIIMYLRITLAPTLYSSNRGRGEGARMACET